MQPADCLTLFNEFLWTANREFVRWNIRLQLGHLSGWNRGFADQPGLSVVQFICKNHLKINKNNEHVKI